MADRFSPDFNRNGTSGTPKMRCYILDRSASADSAALSFTPNSVYFEKTCVPGNSIVILSHVGDELLVPNFFLFGRC